MPMCIDTCYECGGDTILRRYTLRVINPKGDTLFVDPCIAQCVKFMEQGGFSMVSCYRIEVMKVGK